MSVRDPSGRDLPLLAWGETLRQEAKARVRMRRWVLVWLGLFWALSLTVLFPPAPRLVWNMSRSAPIGLYRVAPGAELEAGDMVVARLPAPYRHLAAVRHYLPLNVPLVKRVMARPGDRVCAVDSAVLVNGHRVALRRARDGKGRPMPQWRGCHILGAGELFLLMQGVPDSFDGRYFGFSRADDLVGKAMPLWVR